MTPAPGTLQDWGFDELVREGLGLIPAHAPAWTNHNPSDPGVTLVELLAYFTEVLVYRLGRVTPHTKLQFLRLLKGAGWSGWRALASDLAEAVDARPAAAIEEALDAAVRDIASQDCLVTAADFEQWALDAARQHLGASAGVRALCIVGNDPTVSARQRSRQGRRSHVTIVLVPQYERDDQAMERLCEAVYHRLAPYCLLGTRLHVIGPVYVHVAIAFRLTLRAGFRDDDVHSRVAQRLQQRYGPWDEGTLAEELPTPGKPLYLSEVVRLIDETDGVDFVEDVAVSAIGRHALELGAPHAALGLQIGLHSTLGVDAWLGTVDSGDAWRLRQDDQGRLVSLQLQPWEVLRIHLWDASRRGEDGE